MEELHDPSDVDKVLMEYERAQDVGHHVDGIIHEVTSIVWGANTLLLGFILEVPCNSENQKLVIVSSIVGILMSAYVPWVHHLSKKGQRIAYGICRKIEADLPLGHRLHTNIHDKYPHWKPGLAAVWVLTATFIGAWAFVIRQAWLCLHRGC